MDRPPRRAAPVSSAAAAAASPTARIFQQALQSAVPVFSCTNCLFSARSELELWHHQLGHPSFCRWCVSPTCTVPSGHLRNGCSICTRQFAAPAARRQHMEAAHKGDPAVEEFCSICEVPASSKRRHMLFYHTDIWCEDCDRVFRKPEALAQHTQDKHQNDGYEDSSASPFDETPAPFTCMACRFDFDSVLMFQAHCSAEHNGPRNSVSKPSKQYAHFECPCRAHWQSASSWHCADGDSKLSWPQDCKKCGTSVFPYLQEDLRCAQCQQSAAGCRCKKERSKTRVLDANRPHRQDLCGRCRQMRGPCWQG